MLIGWCAEIQSCRFKCLIRGGDCDDADDDDDDDGDDGDDGDGG